LDKEGKALSSTLLIVRLRNRLHAGANPHGFSLHRQFDSCTLLLFPTDFPFDADRSIDYLFSETDTPKTNLEVAY
jgi:hypothetical protein